MKRKWLRITTRTLMASVFGFSLAFNWIQFEVAQDLIGPLEARYNRATGEVQVRPGKYPELITSFPKLCPATVRT